MITYPNVKLNLGLRILRKRPDGYHDIDTLFFPCDRFRDTLEIISGDDWSRTSASLFARYTRPGQLAQGIFMAPHVVAECLKGAVFAAASWLRPGP